MSRRWAVAAVSFASAMALVAGCGAPLASTGTGTVEARTFFQGTFKSNVEMQLQPDPFVMKQFPNVSPPSEKVRVFLPLYPGAAPASVNPAIGDMGTPMTPQLLDATVYYQSQDASSKIQSWYTRELAPLGYHVAGSGKIGNIKTQIYSDYVEFAKQGAPDIDLGFLRQKNETEFKLKVKYIVTVQRPKNSYLPSDIVKVVLTEGHRSKTVVDPAWIAGVVKQINSLSPSVGGLVNCPSEAGNVQAVNATFYERSGSAIPVKFALPCGVRDVLVGSSSIWLHGSVRLDSAIATVMGT